jgi:hypothetical protein
MITKIKKKKTICYELLYIVIHNVMGVGEQ